MPISDQQKELAEMISESQLCVALTGAGISVPSGIPDFRSPGGLWTKVDPQEVCTIDVWRNDPKKFWSFYSARLDIPDSYEPNPAHEALSELEKQKKLFAVITQNIDGLHQKAGSEKVVEVHGSVRSLCCTCGEQWWRAEIDPFFAEDGVPYCPYEGRHPAPQALKPNVVLFGEMLPEEAIGISYELASECDLLLCIGSSLTVHPVAELPMCARSNGAKVVVISRESAFDEHADLQLDGDVAEELSGVMAALAI